MRTSQSIFNIRNSELHDRVDQMLMNWGEIYLLNKRFGVGEIPDILPIKTMMVLDKLLCEGNCVNSDIQEIVRDKLSSMTTVKLNYCTKC